MTTSLKNPPHQPPENCPARDAREPFPSLDSASASSSRLTKIEYADNIECLARGRASESDPAIRLRVFRFRRRSPERKSQAEAGYGSRGLSIKSRSRRQHRPQRDGFTKICLVLHPVEVHVQILENARRDPCLAGDGDQC